MDHNDHVSLIKKAVPKGGIWADLGSGRGAFTLALAQCLGTNGEIYSVDLDQRALNTQQERMASRFPHNVVHYLRGDFTHALSLPPLNGIVMANSLHFVQEKAPVLEGIRALLQPEGRLVLVEYELTCGNYAIPYPLTYAQWKQLATACGFAHTARLMTRPSRVWGEIYSAVSVTDTCRFT